jgi:hypothetical protein
MPLLGSSNYALKALVGQMIYQGAGFILAVVYHPFNHVSEL